jgi:UDP-glucose 4-epimerase
MHFLVTGGAGFIGSHLTEHLLSEGHYVTVIDNFATGNSRNLLKHPCLKLLPKNLLTYQLEDFTEPIDGIAHLAAIPSVIESWLKPLETHHINLSATMGVIELCQALNIPRLVFASSAAVYGNPSSPLISEDQTPAPISPYGLQKLMSEQYIRLFAEKLNFSWVSLRLFNVFGPRQLPGSQYSGVIPTFVTAIQQDSWLTIYGDGTQTRDFIFVTDVALSFARALTKPLAPCVGLTCNIGTGKSISIIELINVIKNFFPSWESKIKFLPSRSGDIKHSLADVSKAYQILDFRHQESIESGIRILIESLKNCQEQKYRS